VKPPAFGYHRPRTVEEALDVLADLGAEGKVLAGGQSLVPLMSMRLAAPAHLVDVNHLPGLDTIEVDENRVRVGALVRHSALEHHDGAYGALPLLRQALRLVAHPTIRNRGTTVGSLVHGDPAAELPAVLLLLDGTVTLRSTGGFRDVVAHDFFIGPMQSDVRPEELAVAATFAVPPAGSGTSFVELSRRHGDYAMCGVAAVVTRSDGETTARVALLGVGDGPVLVDVT
jgi:aerobic carbon-monoxide dehydrogenase medium subunit